MPLTLKAPGLPDFTSAEAPSQERMHWVKLPFEQVLALYQDGVLKIQRNHLRRLSMADHVTRADLPLHANYLAVRLPDGKAQLVDGYTRIAAIEAEKKPVPKEVWLGVVDVDSPKQVEQSYLAIDSRKAVKTGRDAFEEGLRRAGLLEKVISPVFINGYAVSALKAAAGDSDIRGAVVKFKRAIERLDPLKLEVGRHALPSGALAACLLLAQNEKEETAVQQFTAAASHPEKLTDKEKKQMPGGVKFAYWLADRREAGALSGKNVPVIMAQAIGSYLWQKHKGTGKIGPVTRDQYLDHYKE